SGAGLLQVTACPAAEHDQSVPVPETNVIPGGRVSVTAIGSDVATAPLFAMLIESVPTNPTAMVVGPELEMERSGKGGTTENATLPLVPRLVVTFTLRLPVGAVAAIVNVAAATVSERTLMFVTAIPLPASTVMGCVK